MARRVPVALLVVVVGIAVPLVAYPGVMHSLHLGPSRPSITLPSWAEWKTGAGACGILP